MHHQGFVFGEFLVWFLAPSEAQVVPMFVCSSIPLGSNFVYLEVSIIYYHLSCLSGCSKVSLSISTDGALNTLSCLMTLLQIPYVFILMMVLRRCAPLLAPAPRLSYSDLQDLWWSEAFLDFWKIRNNPSHVTYSCPNEVNWGQLR